MGAMPVPMPMGVRYPNPYPVAVAVAPLPAVLLRRRPLLHVPTTLLLRPSPSSSSPSPWKPLLAVQEDDDGFFTVDYDPADLDGEEEDDDGSPWEGALVYRRDAAVRHVEYATTLERLGLADLSSPHSRARAAAMGMGMGMNKDREAEETPVLVSFDVARRRGRLRLDGIVRTVITLGCYRCAEPAAEGIFANFSLLLTEEPVEEPDMIDLGTIYEEEEDVPKASSLTGSEDEDDENIDWDDRLHFPAGDKEIDISKHIRDIIHLEITLDAFCSPTCKGLCLGCGANLNTSSCSCRKRENPKGSDVKRRGTLKDLLKPMQR